MSNPDRLVRRVVTAVSIGLIVVVCATAAQVFWPRVASFTGMAPQPVMPEPVYRAGDAIDTPEAWHNASPYTLVVFAQANCGACQAAQPYLSRLVTHLDGRATVVMATPGREQAHDARFGHDLGVPDARMYVVPEGTRVRGTPTLVLVTQTGSILGAWEGVGPEEQHEALTAKIDELLDATGERIANSPTR